MQAPLLPSYTRGAGLGEVAERVQELGLSELISGGKTSSNPRFKHSQASCLEPAFPSFLGSRWFQMSQLVLAYRQLSAACGIIILGPRGGSRGDGGWTKAHAHLLWLRLLRTVLPHSLPARPPSISGRTAWPCTLLPPPPGMPSFCGFVWVSDKPPKPLALLHLHQAGQVDGCGLPGPLNHCLFIFPFTAPYPRL